MSNIIDLQKLKGLALKRLALACGKASPNKDLSLIEIMIETYANLVKANSSITFVRHDFHQAHCARRIRQYLAGYGPIDPASMSKWEDEYCIAYQITFPKGSQMQGYSIDVEELAQILDPLTPNRDGDWADGAIAMTDGVYLSLSNITQDELDWLGHLLNLMEHNRCNS